MCETWLFCVVVYILQCGCVEWKRGVVKSQNSHVIHVDELCHTFATQIARTQGKGVLQCVAVFCSVRCNGLQLRCKELDSDGPRHENRTWSHDWFTSVKSWLFAKGHIKERNRIKQPKPNPVTVTVTPGNKKSYVPLLKKDENKKYLEFRT